MTCLFAIPTGVSGGDPIVGLDINGRVHHIHSDYLEYFHELDDWEDIVLIACSATHAVGMKKDGTFVSAGDYRNHECEIDAWTNIVDIKAGQNFTVGLKADGTVVATGKNNYGQCNVSSWTDIVAIAVGIEHTVGLKSDGTVVATGNDNHNDCYVGRWKNVVKIATCIDGRDQGYTLGITKEGEILITKKNHYAFDQSLLGNDWIVVLPKEYRCPGAIDIAGSYGMLGILMADGTYEFAGGGFLHKFLDNKQRIKKDYSENDCKAIAVTYLKNHLKNPSSYQEHSIKIVKDGENYTISIDYSAMNGFGGYSRNTYLCIVNSKSGSILFAYSN